MKSHSQRERRGAVYGRRSSSGSLAMLAAMRPRLRGAMRP
jgi:hypothetical protein